MGAFKAHNLVYVEIYDWLEFQNKEITLVEFAERCGEDRKSPTEIKISIRFFTADLMPSGLVEVNHGQN